MLTSAGNDDIFVATYTNLGDAAVLRTSRVLADPNPVAIDTITNLSAQTNDSTTLGSRIASAAFEIRDDGGNVVYSGTGNHGHRPMPINAYPVDQFGSYQPAPPLSAVAEDLTATIPSYTVTPGVYNIFVWGTDAAANTGACNLSWLGAFPILWNRARAPRFVA